MKKNKILFLLLLFLMAVVGGLLAVSVIYF